MTYSPSFGPSLWFSQPRRGHGGSASFASLCLQSRRQPVHSFPFMHAAATDQTAQKPSRWNGRPSFALEPVAYLFHVSRPRTKPQPLSADSDTVWSHYSSLWSLSRSSDISAVDEICRTKNIGCTVIAVARAAAFDDPASLRASRGSELRGYAPLRVMLGILALIVVKHTSIQIPIKHLLAWREGGRYRHLNENRRFV